MKSKKAFTLIELLVVIAIIGILATIAVISLYAARAKARDAKRVADIKQVQTALEMFFNDQDRYPTIAEFEAGSIVVGDKTYMLNIPVAPTPADGTCDNTTNQFIYTTNSTGNTYSISYCIGSNMGELAAGQKCALPDGVKDGACGLNPVQTRNAQRLADIQAIESAMQSMYSANGYYFKTTGTFDYAGNFLYNNVASGGICARTTCPAQSNWCIKLGTDIGQSYGTACDSGTVYLRNIPLNNYLPYGSNTAGILNYSMYIVNNYNGTSDYFRMVYRLEGSSTKSSDHFVNGVKVSDSPF